jgi:hypothetical protein
MLAGNFINAALFAALLVLGDNVGQFMLFVSWASAYLVAVQQSYDMLRSSQVAYRISVILSWVSVFSTMIAFGRWLGHVT